MHLLWNLLKLQQIAIAQMCVCVGVWVCGGVWGWVCQRVQIATVSNDPDKWQGGNRQSATASNTGTETLTQSVSCESFSSAWLSGAGCRTAAGGGALVCCHADHGSNKNIIMSALCSQCRLPLSQRQQQP